MENRPFAHLPIDPPIETFAKAFSKQMVVIFQVIFKGDSHLHATHLEFLHPMYIIGIFLYFLNIYCIFSSILFHLPDFSLFLFFSVQFYFTKHKKNIKQKNTKTKYISIVTLNCTKIKSFTFNEFRRSYFLILIYSFLQIFKKNNLFITLAIILPIKLCIFYLF